MSTSSRSFGAARHLVPSPPGPAQTTSVSCAESPASACARASNRPFSAGGRSVSVWWDRSVPHWTRNTRAYLARCVTPAAPARPGHVRVRPAVRCQCAHPHRRGSTGSGASRRAARGDAPGGSEAGSQVRRTGPWSGAGRRGEDDRFSPGRGGAATGDPALAPVQTANRRTGPLPRVHKTTRARPRRRTPHCTLPPSPQGTVRATATRSFLSSS